MMLDMLNAGNYGKLSRAFRESPPAMVYMFNYHPLNHYIARLAAVHGAQFVYHLHEPFVASKTKHGILAAIWLTLFDRAQSFMLDQSGKAVVSSGYASCLMQLRFPDYSGKRLLIPLMYEDLGAQLMQLPREYVTFVGPIVPAKGFSTFMGMAELSNDRRLGFQFLVISRLRIPDESIRTVQNLTLVDGKVISDEYFGELMRKSLAVVTPYLRETQSAAILGSYMYGTPVISSDTGGLPEFVRHKKTGYLVSVNAPTEAWIYALGYVRDHLAFMSEQARRLFKENYSGVNWDKHIDELLSWALTLCLKTSTTARKCLSTLGVEIVQGRDTWAWTFGPREGQGSWPMPLDCRSETVPSFLSLAVTA